MSDQKVESTAVKAARERVEALRTHSNKLPEERTDLALYSQQEIEQRNRLDVEGADALRQEAYIAEAEAWASIPPDQQALASVQAVYDWPTHKRTGRGLLVVTSIGRDNAVLALKPASKVGEGGVALYDTSEGAILRGLLEAALYPSKGDVQLVCHESPAFAAAAYGQVMILSGVLASVTTGKSGG